MYQWLLLGHLLGVVMFVGGSGAYSASVDRLPRGRTTAELRALLGVAALGSRLLQAGVLVMLAGGVALTAHAWSFGDGWIVVSIALVVVYAGAGLFVDKRVGQVGAALEHAPDGPVQADLRARTGDRAMHAVDRASAAILTELLFLMVVKPTGGGIVLSLVVALLLAAALTASALRPRRYHQVQSSP
jgi:hypothetical protein